VDARRSSWPKALSFVRNSYDAPPSCGPAQFGPGVVFDHLAGRPARAALGRDEHCKRRNVPRRTLTDKIAGARASMVPLLVGARPLRRSTMRLGAISPSEASAEPPPLLLVGEISHRVLNEYTHAIATLSLARAVTTDVTARSALADAERRLRAYADLHRALRPPRADRRRDLGTYLEGVCAALSCASLRERGVRLTLVPSEVMLPADRCWRVALIIAELVNNAVRHAFDEGGGRILVEVESLGPTIQCRVSDDGRPASCTPPRGWGRSIVESLTQELAGQIEWLFEPSGTRVVLRIPSDPASLD